jgi:hypothetical protein
VKPLAGTVSTAVQPICYCTSMNWKSEEIYANQSLANLEGAREHV